MTRELLLVSHFHWDREWYRPFEVFRGRLVDAIDAVLDLVTADPGYRFVLDGQAIVLEDYLAVRPHRRDELVAGLSAGRLAAGPWYVQPDSLLPAGETHVRNLLHGRAVAGALGPVSAVGYVPDSFGHPAQLPQILAGFGLDPFVYWRGNGAELDKLGPLYRWCAPDGSSVRAWQLPEGYFSAGGLDADGDLAATVARLRPVIDRIVAAGGDPVLLMNGFDHLPPDRSTADVAALIGAERVLLDEAATRLPEASTLVEFCGDLMGARTSNLLPGVWSARMPLKLRNRAVETLLTTWAEPWAAFGHALGLADERPALDQAWRALLCNQAHDSICGCSIDPVHERMVARYDDAEGLGNATLQRALERIAGRNDVRDTPSTETQAVVVFNSSATRRTDVVRIPLEGFPPWSASLTRFDMHPLSMPSFRGVTVDGRPARLVSSDDPTRVRFLPGLGGLDVEFVAVDVPAFGCRRYRVEPARASLDEVDDRRAIDAGDVRVVVADDGSLSVTLGDRTYHDLFAIEDAVDRGDSYDCDPDPVREVEVRSLSVERTRHKSGIARLKVTRELADIGTLVVEACVAPGVPFVRCEVALDNRAPDHRLRLRFPTGAPAPTFEVATTFDTVRRSSATADDTGWIHPAPRTFPQQGWIGANALFVGAPGLPEAEVTPGGDVLVTLVRSVGALARIELRTRPMPAGPEMLAPGAQTQGREAATVTLARDAADARAAEIGMRGVLGAETPLLESGASLLELDARHCVISACKPAEDGDRVVVRVLNPTDESEDVNLRFGLDVRRARPVGLDEQPVDYHVMHQGREVGFRVPPHALRSVRITFG
ncbi:MAG: 2-O-(6-phospho-alpha-D-mannosyl)-D-glycerate hydrolase [Actinomycetota bacterium]|nr:2-O-(6-phospho-alpha-D-mannosyl)-D-glycerate hydrolase [Actinomycetota bacterium]